MNRTNRFERLARRIAIAVAAWAVAHAAPVSAAIPHAARPITFGAPAGLRPAGSLRAGDPFNAVLPSGRIVRPVGTNVVVGTATLGVTLAPDDRYAIVSNGAAGGGGDSLAVIDTQTMTVVDRYAFPPNTAPFAGVLATPDPVAPGKTLVLASGGATNEVSVFDLSDDGHLTLDANPAITVPPPQNTSLANFGHAFPSTIVAARDGRHVFVIDNFGNDVAQIDLVTRSIVASPVPVGLAPFGAATTPSALLVANEGINPYNVLATAADSPMFASPKFEPGRSSSLTILPIDGNGAITPGGASVQMDPAPDGTHAIGGAHPSNVVATPNGAYAFVAMTNVDRIATVSLTGTPRVVSGTELRLYNRGPYGTAPDALAINRDGSRLYVALAGINAVAVLNARDPRHVHRLGLIPTGWEPSSLALSQNGRVLYVTNARGAIWPDGAQSTLQRIDLTQASLRSTTRQALSYQRVVAPVHANPVVPQILGYRASRLIKHVVLVLTGDRTFDAMLGDLGRDASGNDLGDPSLLLFGPDITPNLHALAHAFGLAANFYSDADSPAAGDAVAAAGSESVFTERVATAGSLRRQPGAAGKDPDDYPRLGFIFNSLATRRASFRDYGALLRVSGYTAGGKYSLDVPALAALAGNVDTAYAGYDPSVRNVTRAQEFARDYPATHPDFAAVWLPSSTDPTDREAVADQDRALGIIVDAVTHGPQWSSTAMFVVPDGVESSRDHIDARRSYALVISPYAKRGYVGMHHQSTASILKTEEELLGLPALSLGDALASDMRDFFVEIPDPAPFSAIGQSARAPERAGGIRGE